MKSLQLWCGIECTLNRVGDHYINQCDKNGHSYRLTDLTLFHSLGTKKIRYPCLWELVAPQDLNKCDWSYLDERLYELKRLGFDFIAGFLHHGSGPRYTSLIDPEFPEKFAHYAKLFSSRYPWVSDYTPINEINTTARFSTLYGHWYPHHKNTSSYLKALVLQCKGSVLAMNEIKKINPAARFIQTDDLGMCQSTEELIDQRTFENERRWLSWDLLSGRVTKDHRLYSFFLNHGITNKELQWFETNCCPPDVIGINHYHLSNRYLDHRLELYPNEYHGSNGYIEYADVGAIDTGSVDPTSLETLIKEAWDRYRTPIAITECHARGYRESQIRWFHHVWETCSRLKTQDIQIEAVTAWSLLGTFDWHNLCTRSENFYEPGVFDLRNPSRTPKETALTKMIRKISAGQKDEAPVLNSPGVWETGRRILFNAQVGQYTSLIHPHTTRPILITGSKGTLARGFSIACGARNIHYQSLRRSELNIIDKNSIHEAIEKLRPWAIINSAGYVNVEEAENDSEKCYEDNVKGPANLAEICRDQNIRLVHFSSDLVFNGNTIQPYHEDHPVAPLNVYGKSKALSEELISSIYPQALIIRTSSFFSPWDEHNFLIQTLRILHQQKSVHMASDIFMTPTYVPDLVNETLDLLIDGEEGIVHVTNYGEITWEKFALDAIAIARKKNFKFNPELIKGITHSELKFKAPRPKRSSLVSNRHQKLPPLEDAIIRFFDELKVSI